MLYSGHDGAWKIADFGFTLEGGSKTSPTAFSRGTSGYRAPELLKDELAGYTKKVDIWAVGCIFLQVATGRKAFTGDYDVSSFQRSRKQISIPPSGFCGRAQNGFGNLLRAVLRVESGKRPNAGAFREMILDHIVAAKFREIWDVPQQFPRCDECIASFISTVCSSPSKVLID